MLRSDSGTDDVDMLDVEGGTTGPSSSADTGGGASSKLSQAMRRLSEQIPYSRSHPQAGGIYTKIPTAGTKTSLRRKARLESFVNNTGSSLLSLRGHI